MFLKKFTNYQNKGIEINTKEIINNSGKISFFDKIENSNAPKFIELDDSVIIRTEGHLLELKCVAEGKFKVYKLIRSSSR